MYWILLSVFILGFWVGYITRSFQRKTESKKLAILRKWLQGEVYIKSENGKELNEEEHHWELGTNYIIQKAISKIDLLRTE